MEGKGDAAKELFSMVYVIFECIFKESAKEWKKKIKSAVSLQGPSLEDVYSTWLSKKRTSEDVGQPAAKRLKRTDDTDSSDSDSDDCDQPMTKVATKSLTQAAVSGSKKASKAPAGSGTSDSDSEKPKAKERKRIPQARQQKLQAAKKAKKSSSSSSSSDEDNAKKPVTPKTAQAVKKQAKSKQGFFPL